MGESEQIETNSVWTIYALVDPRTCQIRYVGQTQHHPTVRLLGHYKKKGENVAKEDWLDQLRNLGIRPIVVVLGYAQSLQESLAAEKVWIKRGLIAEWPLLNSVADDRYGSKTKAADSMVYWRVSLPKKKRPLQPVKPVTRLLKPVNRPARVVSQEELDTRRSAMCEKWAELAEKWFSLHPKALSGKAKGIADLAREMAAVEGKPSEWQNYKSSAHHVFHAYRRQQTGDE